MAAAKSSLKTSLTSNLPYVTRTYLTANMVDMSAVPAEVDRNNGTDEINKQEFFRAVQAPANG